MLEDTNSLDGAQLMLLMLNLTAALLANTMDV